MKAGQAVRSSRSDRIRLRTRSPRGRSSVPDCPPAPAQAIVNSPPRVAHASPANRAARAGCRPPPPRRRRCRRRASRPRRARRRAAGCGADPRPACSRRSRAAGKRGWRSIKRPWSRPARYRRRRRAAPRADCPSTTTLTAHGTASDFDRPQRRSRVAARREATRIERDALRGEDRRAHLDGDTTRRPPAAA